MRSATPSSGACVTIDFRRGFASGEAFLDRLPPDQFACLVVDLNLSGTRLCNGLTSAMIGEDRAILIQVDADHGMIESDKAVSMGLIVTELVINAIKYAFPPPWPNAVISVKYRADGPSWRLVVSDNGIGPAVKIGPSHGGLGTAIVEALVKQLDAKVEMESDRGMSVTIASV